MSKKLYNCRTSLEEDRPEIDFSKPENKDNDWTKADDVLDGNLPVGDFPKQIRITVDDREAVGWDFFAAAGTSGLFSERFIDTLGANALRYFSLLSVSLNGKPYFFLRCEQSVDCFDRANSQVEAFRHDPTRIKHFGHYAFIEDLVPDDALFCIPESVAILAPSTVVDRINTAGIKGIRNDPLP